MTISVFLRILAGARIVFFGDTHFDRGVRTSVHGGPIAPLLASTQALRDTSDFAMFNLETPLCESGIPAMDKPISLRSDPSSAQELGRAGFTHAVLANNHSMDRGLKGLARTIAVLRKAGIQPVGASVTGNPCVPVVSKSRMDSVAFLAMADLPGIDGRHVCTDTARIRSHLLELSRRGIPAIVSLHWGTEYSGAVGKQQQGLAERLVAWGATALVGHHAHVVQPSMGRIPSLVAGRPVWYGVGNFVFDQEEPWTRRALVARIVTGSGKARSWTSIELVRRGPWTTLANP